MYLTRIEKIMIALLFAVSTSMPSLINAADFDVLSGTFHMGNPPIAQLVGDQTALPVPGYPRTGRMVTEVFQANFVCAEFEKVDASRALQCENATNGTPSSPTASGPDDDTATRNGFDTFNFFGVPTFTYFAEKGVDYPAVPHPPPSIDIVAETADMSAWYVSWNGTEFHQGSADPNNPKNNTTDAVLTPNPDGSYNISWQSLIVGGPFNGITGYWGIDVCPSPCELIPPAKAPSLEAEQNVSGVTTRTLIKGIGDAVISLDSGYDTTGITFDWTDSDASLLDAGVSKTGSTLTITQTMIDNATAGLHRVVLVVTDTGQSPERFANSTLLLNILDTDPGYDYADTDNDGIANNVDSITDPDKIQTDETTDTAWLMTVSDGVLKLGDTAFCASKTAATLSIEDIANFGGLKCASTSNAEDRTVTVQTGIGGIFDFEVHGLVNGQSVEVVIPLREPIRVNGSYRKYVSTVGWSAFDKSEGDSYASAQAISAGVCPPYDDASWKDGLMVGYDCLKLTMADGGPNDADNGADGILKDPGALSSNPDIDTSTIDSGSLSWGVIVSILFWLGLLRRSNNPNA